MRTMSTRTKVGDDDDDDVNHDNNEVNESVINWNNEVI